MSNFRIFLKANERLFINGAVFKVDRKVSIELMNNATFLLENHIMQAEEATTPLKQLYFVVQLLLMDPINTAETKKMFRNMVEALLETLENDELRSLVKSVDMEVSSGKEFIGLKTIRNGFDLEASILSGSDQNDDLPPAENITEKIAPIQMEAV